LQFKLDFCKFSTVLVTILSQRSLAVSTLNLSNPLKEHTRTELREKAASIYRSTFESEPTAISSAPGRINLIGEHTDYNNGFVLPAAINRTTAVAAGPRDDNSLCMYSLNLESMMRMELTNLRPSRENAWANYGAGVVWFMRQAGATIGGINLAIAGNIPQGAGLSSSAALELACAQAIAATVGFSMELVEMAQLCRQAENEFAGVSCGIMDQFISALGKAHHALFLDCRSLAHEYIPVPPHVRILVCDTGVGRTLAASGYNRRRQECLLAVKQLAEKHSAINSLRDVTLMQLEAYRSELDPVAWKRAHHVVTENERVLESIAALKRNDLPTFGRLMYESHDSLRNNYEVSCPELDTMVDICSTIPGVYGARMTGAGFGGAAICIVDESQTAKVQAAVEEKYCSNTGREASIHACSIEDGASVHLTGA
jgi:galactokinase